MENLILLSNNVSLNLDILETNFINITILITLLFNLIGDVLKASMLERKEKILNKIQVAEQQIEEILERLIELQTQLKQSQFIIEKINEDANLTIIAFAQYNLRNILENLELKATSTKLTGVYKEQQVLREIKNYVSKAALNEALEFCETKLKMDAQIQLINNTIERIGGKQWQAKF